MLFTLNNKIDLTGFETKRELKAILKSIKDLNDYEIAAIDGSNKNVITFNCYNFHHRI